MSVPKELLELLSQQVQVRGSTADTNALMFVGRQGEPLEYSNWRLRVWLLTCTKTGLAGLKFQALRTANGTP